MEFDKLLVVVEPMAVEPVADRLTADGQLAVGLEVLEVVVADV